MRASGPKGKECNFHLRRWASSDRKRSLCHYDSANTCDVKDSPPE